MKVRRNDTVLVIAGRDKGKKAKIQKVLPKENRVVVEGINVVIRHQKPRQAAARQAGRVQKEASIHVSNLMLVCPNCNKNTRVGFKFLEGNKKVRFCKRCQATLE